MEKQQKRGSLLRTKAAVNQPLPGLTPYCLEALTYAIGNVKKR